MDVEFEIPGPGQWSLDRSHFPGGTTPIMQSLLRQSIENAFREQWPLRGIPAETMSVAFVNGFMYSRLRPLVLAVPPLNLHQLSSLKFLHEYTQSFENALKPRKKP